MDTGRGRGGTVWIRCFCYVLFEVKRTPVPKGLEALPFPKAARCLGSGGTQLAPISLMTPPPPLPPLDILKCAPLGDGGNEGGGHLHLWHFECSSLIFLREEGFINILLSDFFFF